VCRAAPNRRRKSVGRVRTDRKPRHRAACERAGRAGAFSFGFKDLCFFFRSAQSLVRLLLNGDREVEKHLANPNRPERNSIMNLHKHMEAIFIGALTFIAVGTALLENLPEAEAKTVMPAASPIATPTHMAVVVIHAPRKA
jgi:hypothetical protein